MMLLSLHVVAIGLLVLVVGTLAYRLGYRQAERHFRRTQALAEGEEPLSAHGADSG
jgi:hypothetical protein